MICQDTGRRFPEAAAFIDGLLEEMRTRKAALTIAQFQGDCQMLEGCVIIVGLQRYWMFRLVFDVFYVWCMFVLYDVFHVWLLRNIDVFLLFFDFASVSAACLASLLFSMLSSCLYPIFLSGVPTFFCPSFRVL